MSEIISIARKDITDIDVTNIDIANIDKVKNSIGYEMVKSWKKREKKKNKIEYIPRSLFEHFEDKDDGYSHNIS